MMGGWGSVGFVTRRSLPLPRVQWNGVDVVDKRLNWHQSGAFVYSRVEVFVSRAGIWVLNESK